MAIQTVSCEKIRAQKLARLWTACDAQRGSTYRYNVRNMVPRPDINNFGIGRFSAYSALPRRGRSY